MIDLTSVLTAILALACSVVSVFIIPNLKKSMSAKDMEQLLKWVDIAVAAAQQIYYQSNGATRKQYVVEFLAEKGYDVDSDEIDAAIESAVLALHDKLKE